MPQSQRKIKLIFVIYWFLLVYVIAALVWWYIALTRQNDQMTSLKLQQIKTDHPTYVTQVDSIKDEQRRKTAQYIGEGATFLLLIVAGALFVYRAVNRELKISQQQQHFMMAVTHELKTPLAIAKLNLETLQKRKLDDVVQQKLLLNTLEEANRMNALCNNMLLSSQIESDGYQLSEEDVNLSELAENCTRDFANRFPLKKFDVKTNDGCFISGDRLLLQMAINNLLDNAVKYSPKESTITLATGVQNDMIECSIADEGSGIAAEERTRIFEKFYRTGSEATRLAKGTGLGLYLVQRIANAHKGKVTVTNNSPKGTIFTLSFKHAS